MKNIREKISSAIVENEGQFLADLRQLMKIPSVKSEAKTSAPFGIHTKAALEKALELGESYGFETKMVNNAMGYVATSESADYRGIVGHLDVVEAGGEWDYPAFDLTENQGYLFGRGVLDNKGPIFSCLFGLKLLKDLGVEFKQPLRIIFGTDEESGSADVPLYLATEPEPSFAFTPDCKFPVVYAERGILNVRVETHFSQGELNEISQIHGEQGKGFVPDDLFCKIGSQTFYGKGKRSPSNAPELGKNAITFLAKEIVAQTESINPFHDYFNWIVTSFHEQHFGEGIELELADEESGNLILTPYGLHKQENGLYLDLAIRYPISVREEQVMARLVMNLFEDSYLYITRSLPSLIFDQDNAEIALLSQAYEFATGFDSTPVATTGATYARVMPNTIAFGPSFPGQKGSAHNVNESIAKVDLLKAMEIYMHAILNLTEEAKK